MTQPTVSSHIDVHLIEKALALTGKTMEDVYEKIQRDTVEDIGAFSIEKFGWYLLSDFFLEEYKRLPSHDNHIKDYEYKWSLYDWISEFGRAINFYQSGNPEPLLSLLEKI